MPHRARAAFLLLAAPGLPRPAPAAVELRIHFSALERILAEQMFTEDGRKYLKGTPKARCNFAYLEHPGVHGDPPGRLRVEARFSGRSALDFLGRCVGLGDSFDLSIVAVPYYEKGAIRFKDVLVSSRRDGFYLRRVRAALQSTLRTQFAYRVAEDAKRMLEEKHGNYTQELSNFQVSAIRVTDDALILTLDFALLVR